MSRPPRLRPSTGAAAAPPATAPPAAARPGARREARGEEVRGSDLLPFEDRAVRGGPDPHEPHAPPDPHETVALDVRAVRARRGRAGALPARVRDALAGPAGPRLPGGLLRTAGGAVLAVLAVVLGIVVLLAVREAPESRLTSVGEGALAEPETGPETGTGAPAEAAAPAEAGGGAAGAAVPEPGPEPGSPEAPVAEPGPEPPPVAPTDASVTVLGVSGSGSAGPTAAGLREAGWQVRLVASYQGAAPGVPTVFHVPGHEAEAALLAARVGAVAVRPAPASLSDSDLTLVVG